MTQANDYTKGNIYRHFLHLMLPLIAGNILQQLYNTIDSVIIGRYAGSEEFAAIGIASSIMNLFLFAMVGMCTGLSILFAQSYGARDMGLFHKYHFHAAAYGTAAVAAIGIIAVIGMNPLLYLMNTPEELQGYVAGYLRIVLGGLCISFLYNFYAALLRSIGKAMISLYGLLIAVILNLILDIAFVAGLHMGTAGAAAATVLAQIISVVFCMTYLIRQHPETFFEKTECVFDKNLFIKMIKISFVTAVHQVSLYIGKLFIQVQINGAGTEMIMAYTATTRIEGFANSFGDSGSAATSVLAAQNYGAQSEQRVKETRRCSFVILIIMGAVSSLIMYITAQQTAGFLLGDSTALPSAVSYLQWISVFYLFCFTGNTFAGYFEGIGLVHIPFIGALSHITLRVILSHFWIPVFGLSGVAWASGIGWILVNMGWGIVLAIVEKRKQRDQRTKGKKVQRAHAFQA